jgi:predicted esterase YcpF (UPF0227 family)
MRGLIGARLGGYWSFWKKTHFGYLKRNAISASLKLKNKLVFKNLKINNSIYTSAKMV